ncbi:G10 protein, partial [Ancylostoma duodenale]
MTSFELHFRRRSIVTMSLTTKLRRTRKQPPEGWDLIEPTLEEFEAKMREAETDPHEGKRRTETLWPIFSGFLTNYPNPIVCEKPAFDGLELQI